MTRQFLIRSFNLSLSFLLSASLSSMDDTKVPDETGFAELQSSKGDKMNFEKVFEQLGKDLTDKMHLIDGITSQSYLKQSLGFIGLVSKPNIAIGREALDTPKEAKKDVDIRLHSEQDINTGILHAIKRCNKIIEVKISQINAISKTIPVDTQAWQETMYRQEMLKELEPYMYYFNHIFLNSKKQNIQISNQMLDETYILSNKILAQTSLYTGNFLKDLINRISHLQMTQIFASQFKDAATTPHKEPLTVLTEIFQNIAKDTKTLSQTAKNSLVKLTEEKKTTK